MATCSEQMKAAILAVVLFALLMFLYPPNEAENTAHDANLNALDVCLFGATTAGLFIVLYLDSIKEGFGDIRVIYTGIAVALLCYRTVLYAYHGWILFMVDLCPVLQFCLLYTLWVPEFLQDADWRRAIFTNLNGPIAGSTFLLSIKISVDNAEVFMSFFLHVAPQWLSFPLRWRIHKDSLNEGHEEETTCSLWKNGMLKIYLKWYLFMGLFLTVQPFIPGLCNLMTLYDWMAGSVLGYELMPRDWPFWKWTASAWVYVTIHGVMASYGMFMASLSFQYRPVHIVYSACVLLGIVARSVGHYFFGEGHELVTGLCEALAAGVLVSATAIYCYMQDKKAKGRETASVAEPLL